MGREILRHEYEQTDFFYYYFIPFQKLLSNNASLIIIPVKTISIILGFTLILYLFPKASGFRNQIKQTILAGFIIKTYCLLLTIEADTKSGSFFHPLTSFHVPHLTIYIRAAVFLFLFFFYYFIWNLLFKDKQRLGKLQPVSYYLLALPFIFQFSPFYHMLIFMGVGSVFFCIKDFSLAKKNNTFLAIATICGLLIVTLISFAFRSWVLNYSANYDLMTTITDGYDYFLNSKNLWEGN